MAEAAPLTVLVAEGSWGTVGCAVRSSGESPAKVFLIELDDIREKGKNKPQATARARFLYLFQHMANYGPAGMPAKRFKKEMGSLWAFRHEVRNLQIRFPCFQDGNLWVLTHGFIKPGAKKKLGGWPQSEIDRAQAIMAEYFQLKAANAKRGKQ